MLCPSCPTHAPHVRLMMCPSCPTHAVPLMPDSCCAPHARLMLCPSCPTHAVPHMPDSCCATHVRLMLCPSCPTHAVPLMPDSYRDQQFRQEFCLLERSVAEAEDHMTKFLCELKTVDWLTSLIPKLQRGSSPTPTEHSHVSRRGRLAYLL